MRKRIEADGGGEFKIPDGAATKRHGKHLTDEQTTVQIKTARQRNEKRGFICDYLKVFGHDGFSVVFNLPELGPQAFHLVLHLHDVLKIPLSAQVQHLDGLRHVLHLK